MIARFSNLEALLSKKYESDAVVKVQLSGIAAEAARICDSVGLSIEESLLYNIHVEDEHISEMNALLSEYSRDYELERETRQWAFSISKHLKSVYELAAADENRNDYKNILSGLADAYLELSSYAGMNRLTVLNLGKMLKSYDSVRGISIESSAIDLQGIEAPAIVESGLERLALFIAGCASPGSKLVLSAERTRTNLEVEVWCSNIAIEYRNAERLSARMEKSWRFISAQRIFRASGSEPETSQLGREYLSFRVNLQSYYASRISDLRRRDAV